MAEGNDYQFSSYGIYSDAVSTTKNLNTAVDTGSTTLNECQTKLNNGAVFMGPACDSCVQGFSKARTKMDTLVSNFSAIANFLIETGSNYKTGDDSASKTIKMENGKITTTTARTSNSGNANQDAIYTYLSQQGFNDAAICGILANIQHESNFNPNALGDNGTSYGICQWHNSRWDSLKSYCGSNGLDSTTIEGQMAYLMYELKEKYPSIYESMKNVPNTEQGAYDAAYIWTVKFERPAGMEASGQKRGNTATSKYWPQYNH